MPQPLVNFTSGGTNGRQLNDPVIAITLAVLLLDLTNQVPEIVAQLTLLHNGLADELIALGLSPCSS